MKTGIKKKKGGGGAGAAWSQQIRSSLSDGINIIRWHPDAIRKSKAIRGPSPVSWDVEEYMSPTRRSVVSGHMSPLRRRNGAKCRYKSAAMQRPRCVCANMSRNVDLISYLRRYLSVYVTQLLKIGGRSPCEESRRFNGADYVLQWCMLLRTYRARLGWHKSSCPILVLCLFLEVTHI